MVFSTTLERQDTRLALIYVIFSVDLKKMEVFLYFYIRQLFIHQCNSVRNVYACCIIGYL